MRVEPLSFFCTPSLLCGMPLGAAFILLLGGGRVGGGGSGFYKPCLSSCNRMGPRHSNVRSRRALMPCPVGS